MSQEQSVGTETVLRHIPISLGKARTPLSAPLPVSSSRRASLWCIHQIFRLLMTCYVLLLRLAQHIGRSKRPLDGQGYEILLTGTFYSDNWVKSHFLPLVLSKQCARIRMVSTDPVPHLDKVEGIYPPSWLVRIIGRVPARLATFVWAGLRRRPHFVGGFHLLINGLVAALLGRFIGARSLYFCVGGAAEVIDGGMRTESRLFDKLETPDSVVEHHLLQAVAAFDHVITTGSSAIKFFRLRGIENRFHMIAGGIDTQSFYPPGTTPGVDLILVGRLVAIKRIDIFLHAIKRVQAVLPNVSAFVVGDGPLRSSLEQLATQLNIDHNVTFVGHQNDVGAWLRQAKLFVLTSDSEGLPHSVREAMMCGLPGVVSCVGDLEDLVEDGVNGYLVSERTPEAFARHFLDLLTDRSRLDRFSQAACHSVERYNPRAVAQLWDDIFAGSS